MWYTGLPLRPSKCQVRVRIYGKRLTGNPQNSRVSCAAGAMLLCALYTKKVIVETGRHEPIIRHTAGAGHDGSQPGNMV